MVLQLTMARVLVFVAYLHWDHHILNHDPHSLVVITTYIDKLNDVEKNMITATSIIIFASCIFLVHVFSG